MSEQVRVKKVSAFPIDAQIKDPAGVSVQGKILKLTMHGFLIEISPTAHQPGDRFDCIFELPVLHQWVNQPGRMVKLYAHWKEGQTVPGMAQAEAPKPQALGASHMPAGLGVKHLMEIHFENLNEENKRRIREFLAKITKTR